MPDENVPLSEPILALQEAQRGLHVAQMIGVLRGVEVAGIRGVRVLRVSGVRAESVLDGGKGRNARESGGGVGRRSGEDGCGVGEVLDGGLRRVSPGATVNEAGSWRRVDQS